MKFRHFIFALLISAGVIAAFTSCRSNGKPTSPWAAIFTATFTISPTPLDTATPTSTYSPTNVPTATPSNTSSYSPTYTSTYTLTYSPTYTSTNTPVDTPTITLTGTSTNTPTNSPTYTLTPTPTRTVCVCATVQNTYTFESSTDCWSTVPDEGQPASIIVDYGLSTTQKEEGSSSFFTTINNGDVALHTVNLTTTYATPQNLNGNNIIVYVYVDAGLVSTTDWQTAVQVFYKDSVTGWHAPWHQMNLGTDEARWFPVTVLVSDGASVTAIGLQLTQARIGGSGNIYIDNVQIVDASTATPTSTPSVTDTPAVTYTPSATPTITNTYAPGGACTWVINHCEDLYENGSWSSEASGVSLYVSNINFTEGIHSLGATFNGTGTGWQKFGVLKGAYPSVMTGATTILVDVIVDSTITSNSGGWNQFYLQANSGGTFASNNPSLIAGSQTVTFVVSGSAPATVTIFEFAYNSGGNPYGNLYMDNIRVVYTSCPSPQLTPYISWDFENGLVGSWNYMGVGTAIAVTSPGKYSNYALDVTATYTASGQNAGAYLGFGPTDASGFHGVRAQVWLDSSAYSGGTAGGFLQVNGVGSSYPMSPWTNVSQNMWTQLDWPTSTAFGLVDPTQLNFVQVIVQTQSGSFGTGHVKIDNVEFY